MKPILFALPGSEVFAGKFMNALAPKMGRACPEIGRFILRRFPDGETYLKVDTTVKGHPAILVCTLDRPDEKILTLLFFSETLKSLGATQVGLVAPYLAYMRQDKRFHAGEAVTSDYFSRLISNYFQWMVTVDPHLHRHHSLPEIYSIPTRIVHGAPFISSWIQQHITRPLIIGPDAESEQWVSKVARDAGTPYITLRKTRLGDKKVKVTLPDMAKWKGYAPVLVDDIISTAKTMISATKALIKAKMPRPVCVGVHGVFAGDAYGELKKAGAAKIVTCNSIRHRSNRLDLSGAMADAALQMEDFCNAPW